LKLGAEHRRHRWNPDFAQCQALEESAEELSIEPRRFPALLESQGGRSGHQMVVSQQLARVYPPMGWTFGTVVVMVM
jgi:hypothetical protein